MDKRTGLGRLGVRVTRTTKPPFLAGLLRLDLIRAWGTLLEGPRRGGGWRADPGRARRGGEGLRAEGAAAEKEQRRSGVRRKKERGEEAAPTSGPWLSERAGVRAGAEEAGPRVRAGPREGRWATGKGKERRLQVGCWADLSFFSLLFCSFSN
jgi:hypothetical protein